MFDLSKPSEVTGLRRAVFELCVAISAAKCVDEMQQAVIGHVTRAIAMRLGLELLTPDARQPSCSCRGESHEWNCETVL